MDDQKEHKLAANSLSVIESIVMGVAGSAPAFSLSATMAVFIATVGTLAPASILYCGIIMFGISLSFMHLNKAIVNAGTSYAWVSQIFGRFLGFFAGWALLVSSAVFMVSGSVPAATSTLLLIAPEQANNPIWANGIAALWITFICVIAVKGIKPASYLQMIMTGIEVFILVAIIIAGIYRFIHLPAHVPSLKWFSLIGFTPTLFATGALTAVFLYWGWDVALSLNEETKNTTHGPGLGAFWAVIIIILLFVTFTIALLLMLTDTEIQDAGPNIVFAMADKLVPRPWSYFAIISVLLSSAGTLETSILQFTRTLFAEARDKVLHPRYGKLHDRWNTPWVATFVIWFFGIALLFLSSFFTTVMIIIKDSVNALGLQIAIYYSLTGFACAWYYRFMYRSVKDLISYIIWPIFSSVFLIVIVAFSIPTFDMVTNIVGFGGLLLGLVPFFMNVVSDRYK
ncbi:MAG: APC family permease [Legionella sp.]|jgi:amino acid transporter